MSRWPERFLEAIAATCVVLYALVKRHETPKPTRIPRPHR